MTLRTWRFLNCPVIVNKTILGPAPRRFIISWRTLSYFSTVIQLCTLSTLSEWTLIDYAWQVNSAQFCNLHDFPLYMSPINFHLIRDTLHYSISPLFDCPLPINHARTWRSWRIRRGDNSTQLETCTLFQTRCSYALVRPLGPSVLVNIIWVETFADVWIEFGHVNVAWIS